MPYSWAKTKAARNAADLVDLCCGAGSRERMLRMLGQGQSAKGLVSGLKQKQKNLHKDLEESIKHKNSVVHEIQLGEGRDLADLRCCGSIRFCRRTTSPAPWHESRT